MQKLLKLDFKRTVNWNKYQLKVTIQAQNPYLNYLIDLSFQEVVRLFVLSFDQDIDRYFLPTAKMKDYK